MLISELFFDAEVDIQRPKLRIEAGQRVIHYLSDLLKWVPRGNAPVDPLVSSVSRSIIPLFQCQG